METDDTQKRFLALLEESAKREQELKQALLEARWSQESTAAKAANLEVKLKESERENAALEKLIIKEGYIITTFNGEMALCRDPWHQPKEEQP